MVKKIKGFLAAAAGFAYLAAARAAAFAQTGGISERTTEEVSQRVVDLVKGITIPLGSALIFIAIVVTAFKIIATAGKPEERAKVLGSLPYILGGGVLLGGAVMAAGWIIGLMLKAGQ
jgi:hypothetical protein